jgi:hypothetical protein
MTEVPQARTDADGSWLTTTQVAKIMNLDPGTVRKHSERFRGVVIGDTYRFPPDCIERLRGSDIADHAKAV